VNVASVGSGAAVDVVRAGALPAALEALASHQREELIARRCPGLISNLAIHCGVDAVGEFVRAPGAVALLMSTLTCHPTSAEVQRRVTNLLLVLCDPARSNREVLEAVSDVRSVIPGLLGVLEGLKTHEKRFGPAAAADTATNTCSVLIHLAVSGRVSAELAHALIQSADSCIAGLQCLREGDSSAAVVVPASVVARGEAERMRAVARSLLQPELPRTRSSATGNKVLPVRPPS
jgi:hypothetical protein